MRVTFSPSKSAKVASSAMPQPAAGSNTSKFVASMPNIYKIQRVEGAMERNREGEEEKQGERVGGERKRDREA